MIQSQIKKMLVCDMDGTLVESKCSPDAEMSGLINDLLEKYYFAVISGASLTLLETRFLPFLSLNDEREKRLFLLPSIGAGLYKRENGKSIKMYEKILSEDQSHKIVATLETVLKNSGFSVAQTWGPLIEKRGTSVTFSALGQNAPLEEKQKWDPDQKKRTVILESLKPLLSEFSIAIGGLTSLDITEKGIDKAFGINQLSTHTGIEIAQMLYFGDALYENGNDYSVVKTGIECKAVKDVSETKKYFQQLLG